MLHPELISQPRSDAADKSTINPADRGDNASPPALSNLAVRRRMADELVERGLSKQAAARLLRLDPE